MVHLTQLIAERKKPFHTFEFFPPRTEPGVANLLDRIERLAASPLQPPLAVSVTWGAGGSTSDRSLDLAESISKMGIEVILHLTCTNMPKTKVDKALTRARELGIQNILALRGDVPRADEYAVETTEKMDEFQHADDLVRYIRQQHGDYFCIGVAGYSTPHPDSESAESEMHWLKVKCDAGADFIITQLFYDVSEFGEWVARCREAGINQPIIPGVMPLQSYSSFRRLVNLTGVEVPDEILRELQPIKADDAAVKAYGTHLSTKMVRQMMDAGVVPGVHFCTLNLEKSVRTILDNLGWNVNNQPSLTNSPRGRHNQLILDDSEISAKLRDSSPRGIGISSSEASQIAQWELSRHKDSPQKATNAKPIQPVGEDSWDEFPNGRFTDVRSPAYGEIDGWGSGLKITPARAFKEWGVPATLDDLSALFTRYLNSDPSIPSTPFCDLPLSPESAKILPQLLALNSPKYKYWTVGSQPAVDAANSEDPVHGWGPPGGYVFQKAFVEFFVPPSELSKIQGKLITSGKGQITMYAGNRKGDFKSNASSDTVNAVTWGVFPGQEIAQSTIIEEISFHAWKEEAFDIWGEWARLYPANSPARRLLETITNEWWLVSLIHQDYKDTNGLWNFLLADEECD